MEGACGPTHDLMEVQEKVRVGFVHYRTAALEGAFEVELSRPDIDACVLQLSAADFHKTMLATNPKWAGCWQDVYKPTFVGIALYVKWDPLESTCRHASLSIL